MKLNLRTRDEKGITIVGLIIIILISAFIVVIMKWAFGLSQTVKEKTKKHETIDLLKISNINR